MRRPLVLATALAAELAVSTLVVAPPATAQPTPEDAPDPTTVSSQQTGPEPTPAETPDTDLPAPVRTGRADPAPVPAPAPDAAPDAATDTPTTTVRTGRLDAASASSAPSAPSESGRRRGPTPGSPDAPEPTPTDRTAPRADLPPTSTPEPVPDVTPTSAPPATSPATHVVVAGEHLWAIATEQVATASGRAPSDLVAGDVVTYWVRLCMANRPHLRSGNPSLIYAGEVIELPSM